MTRADGGDSRCKQAREKFFDCRNKFHFGSSEETYCCAKKNDAVKRGSERRKAPEASLQVGAIPSESDLAGREVVQTNIFLSLRRCKEDKLAFAVHAYVTLQGYKLVATGSEAEATGAGETFVHTPILY